MLTPTCPHCGEEVPKDEWEYEPDSEQVTFDDIPDGSSDSRDPPTVEDAVEEVDWDALDVTGPDLLPGEGWNEEDPAEW